MSARRPRVCISVIALVLAVAPLHAQEAPRDSGPLMPPRRLARVSVSAHFGEFRPAGRSELFSLLDRALTPGSRPLRPRIAGAELRVQLTQRWGVLVGAEGGGTTVASVSQVQPGSGTDPVRQQTTFDLTSTQSLGVEWQALRWRGAGPGASDHLRIVLGGGAGIAHYRLRQWGDFVDVQQKIAFSGDLRSSGRGTVRYAIAGVELPLRPRVALRGEIRRQAGSAPMSADYATFDRIDLGGTTLSIGAIVHPFVRIGRR